MERQFAPVEEDGKEILKCECGSDMFLQETCYYVTEEVKLKKSEDSYTVISYNIKQETLREEPEYSNRFVCSKCNKEYAIMTSIEGEESVE